MTYGPQTNPCYDEAQTYSPTLRTYSPSPLGGEEPGGEGRIAPTKESTGWHGQAVS